MTYIFDMAGGTEYQGEEMTCSHPLETKERDAAAYHAGHQVELQLVEIEFTLSPVKSIIPDSVDIGALIRAIED